ncbi:MAG: peptidase U32 family protein [Spirochaetota bacterium]
MTPSERKAVLPEAERMKSPPRTMELVSPAGNAEKCAVAFHYGADAVYIGGTNFNLRAMAAGASAEVLAGTVRDAHEHYHGKVYLTLNAYLHEAQSAALIDFLSEIRDIPFDGYIVSDLGTLTALERTIPSARIHVSTQANVTNALAAERWRSLGASRIVLARELTLDEIRAVRDGTDAELEVFVHGAMCIAYAGRCLVSNYLTSRNANSGDCSHVCRWQYRLLEERTRAGEYLPVIDGDGYAMILSSKDLAMARHLKAVSDAGVDAVKIEGRMKSVYYVANVTRVYRKLIDALSGATSFDAVTASGDLSAYIDELEKVTHRMYGTGFFFGGPAAEGAHPSEASYIPGRRLMAMVTSVDGARARITVYNTISPAMTLVAIGRDYCTREYPEYKLMVRDDSGIHDAERVRGVDEAYIETVIPLSPFDILTVEQ